MLENRGHRMSRARRDAGDLDFRALRGPFPRIVSVLMLAAATATADSVILGATKDNTLYEDAAGGVSNGAGQYMFVGRVALAGGGKRRRAVLAFPVAEAIPAGSTITNVAFTLWMSRTPVAGDQEESLHRLLVDWGEGKSNAPLEEGMGTAAAPGDATWRHTFFDTDTWNASGGDFSSVISGSQLIGAVGSYTWTSTARMVQDVQGWLDTPESNHGWLLLGNEISLATAKRFNTREFTKDPTKQPILVIEFTPAGACGDNTDCADDDACTFDRCVDQECDRESASYGDLASAGGLCGPDGTVDLLDILAVLDGFQGEFAAGCTNTNIDISGPGDTCMPGGGIDLLDILAVLDASQNTANCCP